MKEDNQNKETELKIPPPVFYLIAILVGLLLNYFVPIDFISKSFGIFTGLILVVLSIAIIPLVLFRYKKMKTPFDVRQSAKVLITDGPNKFSRNPGYFSLTLLYIGIGFLLLNTWILLFTFFLFIWNE